MMEDKIYYTVMTVNKFLKHLPVQVLENGGKISELLKSRSNLEHAYCFSYQNIVGQFTY
jgi:hypothetical protein